MFFVILIFAAVAVFAVFRFAKNIIRDTEPQIHEQLLETERLYAGLAQEKEEAMTQRFALEKEAAEIFTLYEIAKEVTKKTAEEEAFAVFKARLQENGSFDDCELLDVEAKDIEARKSSEGCFLFPLREKKRMLGYLAFRKLAEKDKEKMMILGHQFALALRRIKLYQEVEELAIKDSLTSVYTRRYFLQRFEEELKRSALRKISISLLMIDVDYFKGFNDQYGHLVGDQILKSIGEIIRGNVREIDIPGRYGGEEFAVALPDTDLDGAKFAAERIRAAVEEAVISAYDTAARVTVSIGLATFPRDGKIMAELVDKADWALYRAKKLGRNRVCIFGVYE